MRRIRSAEYFSWGLAQWCAFVRALDVDSLTAWAMAHRSSYNHARALQRHRDVAEALHWHVRLADGEPDRLSDEEYASRFQALGARTAADLWSINNDWARRLSREGRLNRVRELLGIDPPTRHTPDVGYFLERCAQYDFFEAWTLVARSEASTARRLGLLPAIRANAQRRPAVFDTAGGPVKSFPELITARLLESARVPFRTQPVYPLPSRPLRGRPPAGDFALGDARWIEIWGIGDLTGTLTDRQREYLERRRKKVRLATDLGLLLVGLEGTLLYRGGFDVYVDHVWRALELTAKPGEGAVEPRKLVGLERLSDKG